ncbi:hypothetical protein SAMN05660691_03904 [Rheinheimera pacifica]|uniref:Uncharacterized protein n=1 Tax=Rheinheimera pacifica TaxID=173990 RepID=A0A1H6NB33_9GAMM|nr:hypothetical protein [Rheinheimera pacifica]SEI12142.1 hypothetical protein SAMN05660691_03904 [Rheinheimera pacifica]
MPESLSRSSLKKISQRQSLSNKQKLEEFNLDTKIHPSPLAPNNQRGYLKGLLTPSQNHCRSLFYLLS